MRKLVGRYFPESTGPESSSAPRSPPRGLTALLRQTSLLKEDRKDRHAFYDAPAAGAAGFRPKNRSNNSGRSGHELPQAELPDEPGRGPGSGGQFQGFYRGSESPWQRDLWSAVWERHHAASRVRFHRQVRS